MKKKYKIYQVDSFTKERFEGNPAGVVPNADGLTEEDMQKIARELNNSETAFIFSSDNKDYDVTVRFFTPLKEVPICGHATIAAHYVRAKENKLGNVRVIQKTGAGILPVDIIFKDEDYEILMTQGKISIGEPISHKYEDELLSALGIGKENLRKDCPIVVASTGHSKVMIGINDTHLLHKLLPDYSKLTELSKKLGCNGYYVFTLNYEEKELVHGRMFAPAIGILEDPVTGNANGPLGAYLVHYGLVNTENETFSFEAIQGEAIKRPGKMKVNVKIQNGEPQEVQIMGSAVIIFSTEIELDHIKE